MPQSVRISKVKGLADDDMVKVGNDFADRAADFGKRRVSDLVMDVRRRFCLRLFSLVSCCFGAASFLCCYCSSCG